MEPIPHEEGATRLTVGERPLELPGPLRDAWRHEGAVLVMLRPEGGAREVWIYDEASLERLHAIKEPEGWSFDRLTSQQRGPSVIAITDERIHGHGDWHFLIDFDAGTLTRTSPSH